MINQEKLHKLTDQDGKVFWIDEETYKSLEKIANDLNESVEEFILDRIT